jgi:alpha-mannosidase
MRLYFNLKTSLLKILLTILFVSFCTAKNETDIIVHIIPHTHDDAGWLWTLEQYYSGTGGARVSVKNILDSFVDSLYHNEERTFTYVEMAFFIKWYKNQSEIVKNKVKALISQKRFEFINGGYVMHDEAASYYQHSIDQMRLGLLFLKQEFDYVPDVAWFIDPFGHSASNAYVLAKMGFKKIVLVRIDYKEKEARKAQKSLEFYWVPFGQLDSNTRIFTHIAHDHYNPPAGLEDFISDAELTLSEENLRIRAAKLLESIKDINGKYRSKNHLLMYGDDFSHNKADANFLNIEKLMKYINTKDMGMKLVYSTPSKYFEKVFEQVNDWPLFENQDFFPYADGEYAYWTGYFTSRPYLKGIIRDAGNYLVTVSKELFEVIATAKKGKNFENLNEMINANIEKLFNLREYLAICQHHDAVSGTARELVSEDYIDMLNRSLNDSKAEYHKLIQAFLQVENVNLCIDPVVDIKCEEDIYTFNGEKKVSLKVTKGKGTASSSAGVSVLKNFFFNKNYNIAVKSHLNGENDESEIFCVDEEKDKAAFCQVYFNNQNNFVITKGIIIIKFFFNFNFKY